MTKPPRNPRLGLPAFQTGTRQTGARRSRLPVRGLLRAIGARLALLSPLMSTLLGTPALAQDPAGSGPIVGALRWLQDMLLGTAATVVAVVAVASVGFMMLTGRLNWRYGASVILGCFILFGATRIVAGIQTASALGN